MIKAMWTSTWEKHEALWNELFSEHEHLKREYRVLEEKYDTAARTYELLRIDYDRMVSKLVTALTGGPRLASMTGQDDPFAEDPKAPDEWLQPEEGALDIKALEQRLSEPHAE